MQLDKVAIVLRPRGGWEAVDLGFRMAMRWAGPVWRVWFAVFVPAVVGLSLALNEWPWAAALIVWWLKPVFDRWVLHVLSRAVFGATPSLVQSLGAWREVLTPGLGWALLTRLWDTTRSFTLPVTQLERQLGAPARVRRRLLKQRAAAHAFALTAVCAVFESIALYGALSIGTWFATDVQWSTPHATLQEAVASVASWWTWRETLCYALAISLIEPFYVAAGFALYLNRRVLLEGWDLEVALRRVSERLAAQADGIGAAALALLLCLGLGTFALPAPAHASGLQAYAARLAALTAAAADDTDDDSSDDDEDTAKPDAAEVGMCPAPYQPRDSEAHRSAREILGDAVFGGERKDTEWRSIETGEKPKEASKPSSAWGDVLSLFASLLRIIAWVALAALATALIWVIARQWQQRTPRETAPAPPTQLFGLAIAPESLPPDIAAAARALVAQGQLREALSLLYRGALSYLVHERGLSVRRGATEGDVLNLARKRLPDAFVAYFEQLMPAWMEAAYAARLPTGERVAGLCDLHSAAMPRRPAGAEASA